MTSTMRGFLTLGRRGAKNRKKQRLGVSTLFSDVSLVSGESVTLVAHHKQSRSFQDLRDLSSEDTIIIRVGVLQGRARAAFQPLFGLDALTV